jgi:hypothetical protein
LYEHITNQLVLKIPLTWPFCEKNLRYGYVSSLILNFEVDDEDDIDVALSMNKVETKF